MKLVYVIADDGRKIQALYYVSGDMGGLTNCHGVTFVEGKLWIQDDQVKNLMEGDSGGYEVVTAGEKVEVGDIMIFLDADYHVIHSVTVTAVGQDGRATEVMGEGGWDFGALVSAMRDAFGGWKWIRIYRPKDVWHQSIITRLQAARRWWAELFEQMMLDHWGAESRRQMGEIWDRMFDPPRLEEPKPEAPAVSPCGAIM